MDSAVESSAVPDPVDRRGIDRWDARADAYDAFARGDALFADIAERLVGLLGDRPAGPLADLAAGAGYLAERLLAAEPNARIHVCEPAPRMLARARDRLGARVAGYHAIAVEESDRLPLAVAAMGMNAALHLIDERALFAAAARRLVAGGVVVANLWGHSFDETCGEPALDWKAPTEAALREGGLVVPPWPVDAAIRPRSRAGLAAAARAAGMTLVSVRPWQHVWSVERAVRFRATDPAWLGHLAAAERARVIERACAIGGDDRPIHVIDIVARRP